MNESTVKSIEKLCDGRLVYGDSKMAKAQVMLRNIKPLKKACIEAGDEFGYVPIEALDKLLSTICKKYDVAVSNMTVITDSEGGLHYNGGMWFDVKSGKGKWLLTVHAVTSYELMVKMCLLGFVKIKSEGVGLRVPFEPSRL